MKKIKLTNIVYLSGEDYTRMEEELDPEYNPEGVTAAWLNEEDIINYLLQWFNEPNIEFYDYNEYPCWLYSLEEDKGFFGKQVEIPEIPEYNFLLNNNQSLGSVSLSVFEIIEY